MEKEPVWNKAFIEIALRAIRRLHIDYGMWGLGQDPKNSASFEKLNQGPGIEVASEPDVCAAISQEFINSRFTNGAYFNDKHRHYEIDREVSFTDRLQKKIAVDLFIDRYKTDNKGTEYFKFPAIIQAKRAHYYTPEIATGNLKNFKVNWGAIKEDIQKIKGLKKISDYVISREKYQGKLEGAFLHTLFWGVCELQKFDPSQFVNDEIIKNIGGDLVRKDNIEVRWMPLKWNSNTLEVNKWFWIALLEIDRYKTAPDPENEDNWFLVGT